jgi:hypothetical protein
MVLPPVTPSPNQLPLNDPNWSWDRFEAFCLDLISQFAEVKNCHRYGKQGDFQRGIDIFADLYQVAVKLVKLRNRSGKCNR